MIGGNKTHYLTDLHVLLALVLLTSLLRLPSLEQPFDNDSGANAYHARLIVRGEPLYGTHHPGHHMPAVYYVYALAFRLLGDRTLSVKLLLIPWTVLTGYVVYLLGRLIDGRWVGALAALSYTVLTSHVYLFGSTAEIELFANLPRTGAVLLLLYLVSKGTPPWSFVWVGVLGAASFLFKAVYLSPMAMAGLVPLLEWWTARGSRNAWRQLWQRWAWTGIGFLGGVLPVVAYFASQGLLHRFLMVFTIGRQYVKFRQQDSMGPYSILLYPVLGLGWNNPVVFSFGIAGALASLLRAKRARRATHRPARQATMTMYIALWTAFSFIEAGASGAAYSHYYLLLVPPIVLLASWFATEMYRLIIQATGKGRLSAWPIALYACAAIAISGQRNWDYYSSYIGYKRGRISHQEFITEGWKSTITREMIQCQRLADYIRAHTDQSDYVYYWSGAVQFYYIANRRCPIDMIWPIYAEATGPYQRIFGPRTRYVILGESHNIPRPQWIYEELAANYELETIIGGEGIYRRRERPLRCQPCR